MRTQRSSEQQTMSGLVMQSARHLYAHHCNIWCILYLMDVSIWYCALISHEEGIYNQTAHAKILYDEASQLRGWLA